MFSWCCCSTKHSGPEPEIQLSLNLIQQYSSAAVQTLSKDMAQVLTPRSLQESKQQLTDCWRDWYDDEERWFHCQFEPAMVIRSTTQDADCSESTDCPIEDSDESQDYQLSDEQVAEDKEDWWIEADPNSIPGCAALDQPVKIVKAQVVKFDSAASEEQLLSLYDELGACQPTMSYIAVWLKLNDVSLVILSECHKGLVVQVAEQPDLVMERLKLILNPVKVKLPFPTKSPKDAETVGSFFGKAATLTGLTKAHSGADIAFVQIDLYAKWMMRLALQQVGFRLDNTLELLLVDWSGKYVLSSIRLMVTQTLLNRLG